MVKGYLAACILYITGMAGLALAIGAALKINEAVGPLGVLAVALWGLLVWWAWRVIQRPEPSHRSGGGGGVIITRKP